MSNFTDLEDAISDCWSIVTDLRHFIKKYPDDPRLKILNSFAEMYDYKFERAFDLSEDCLKEYYIIQQRNKTSISDATIEKIAEKHSDFGGDISREKWISFAREVLAAKTDELPW